MNGWFVTATDTNVGKTFVASALIRWLNQQGLTTAGYKPAASGALVDSNGRQSWEDVEALYRASGEKWPRELICPQTFELPLAPPFAARRAGKIIDESLLIQGAQNWAGRVAHLIVEGAGGWLSPISDNWSNADLAAQLKFPVLLVARLGLGTINHTLLTLESIERRGLPILGIVLTESTHLPEDISTSDNPAELAQRTPHPILAVIPHQTGQPGEIPLPLRSPVWLDLAREPQL